MGVAGARLLLCGLVVAVVGGCQGNGGAVSVRWRVRDVRTGMSYDPGQVGHRTLTKSGVCCPIAPGDVCAPENAWIVDSVHIVLGDPDSGGPIPGIADKLVYPCSEREATTGWTLPVGRYAVSLSAAAHDGNDQPVQAATPAAEVRDLTAGGVVNLQVIEVSVDPLPLPAVGSMATQ
jgi:hypothetical protein